MHISYILDTFGGGGKERRCLQVIQGLNAEGYKDIQVIIVNDNIAYKELYDTSAKIEIINRKKNGLNKFQTAITLFKLLKGFQPDVVQAWGLMSAGIVLLVKPFMKFTFLVSYVADADAPKGVNALINKICNVVCKKSISNSKAGLLAYGIPSSKAVLIYNGFNEKRFSNVIDRQKKKAELGISTEYVIAMVATFWQTKDWQCYIDAAKLIIKTRQDITFLAVGKGPQWDFYNGQIKDEERFFIRMQGRRDDVDEIYQICDLTVLTSFHGEGVSNSIMESMAWGVPVIATNNGGTPEIIVDGESGKLIDGQTSERVAAIISELIDQPVSRAKMGEKAAETVRDSFLLQRMTKDYMELYKSLNNEH